MLLVLTFIGILFLIILLILIELGILNFLNSICIKIRGFINNNHSFFTLIFIFMFFIEQLILITLSHVFKEDIVILQILISIFALIVVTTATLEKTFLEIKLKQSEQEKLDTIKDNEEFLEDIDTLIEENEKLRGGRI